MILLGIAGGDVKDYGVIFTEPVNYKLIPFKFNKVTNSFKPNVNMTNKEIEEVEIKIDTAKQAASILEKSNLPEFKNQIDTLKKQIEYFSNVREEYIRQYSEQAAKEIVKSLYKITLGEKIVETSYNYLDNTILTSLKNTFASTINNLSDLDVIINDLLEKNKVEDTFPDPTSDEHIAERRLRKAKAYIVKAFESVEIASLLMNKSLAVFNKENNTNNK